MTLLFDLARASGLIGDMISNVHWSKDQSPPKTVLFCIPLRNQSDTPSMWTKTSCQRSAACWQKCARLAKPCVQGNKRGYAASASPTWSISASAAQLGPKWSAGRCDLCAAQLAHALRLNVDSTDSIRNTQAAGRNDAFLIASKTFTTQRALTQCALPRLVPAACQS